MNEDARLTWLTKICLALPEAKRNYVRKKTFAYFLDDHHLVIDSYRGIAPKSLAALVKTPF